MKTVFQALDPQDPIVRTVCRDISLRELRLKTTQDIIDSLLDFVYASNNKGETHDRKKPTIIGLSANQVGLTERISIVDLSIRRKNYSDVHIMVNPHIVWKSKTLSERKEGCVNLPNIWGFVPRSQRIDVMFLDRWGNAYTMRAVGWAATLLQHETDHLDGKLFIDHLADPKKALHVSNEDFVLYKKDPKAWRKFIDVSSLRR